MTKKKPNIAEREAAAADIIEREIAELEKLGLVKRTGNGGVIATENALELARKLGWRTVN